MQAKTSAAMLVKRVEGVLKAGDGAGVKAQRGVGAEFGFDMIGAGRPRGAAKHVVDLTAQLTAIAAGHEHLGFEALREGGGIKRRPGDAAGNIAHRPRWG